MDRIPFDRKSRHCADRADSIAGVARDQIGRRISGLGDGPTNHVVRGRSGEYPVASVAEQLRGRDLGADEVRLHHVVLRDSSPGTEADTVPAISRDDIARRRGHAADRVRRCLKTDSVERITERAGPTHIRPDEVAGDRVAIALDQDAVAGETIDYQSAHDAAGRVRPEGKAAAGVPHVGATELN